MACPALDPSWANNFRCAAELGSEPILGKQFPVRARMALGTDPTETIRRSGRNRARGRNREKYPRFGRNSRSKSPLSPVIAGVLETSQTIVSSRRNGSRDRSRANNFPFALGSDRRPILREVSAVPRGMEFAAHSGKTILRSERNGSRTGSATASGPVAGRSRLSQNRSKQFPVRSRIRLAAHPGQTISSSGRKLARIPFYEKCSRFEQEWDSRPKLQEVSAVRGGIGLARPSKARKTGRAGTGANNFQFGTGSASRSKLQKQFPVCARIRPTCRSAETMSGSGRNRHRSPSWQNNPRFGAESGANHG